MWYKRNVRQRHLLGIALFVYSAILITASIVASLCCIDGALVVQITVGSVICLLLCLILLVLLQHCVLRHKTVQMRETVDEEAQLLCAGSDSDSNTSIRTMVGNACACIENSCGNTYFKLMPHDLVEIEYQQDSFSQEIGAHFSDDQVLAKLTDVHNTPLNLLIEVRSTCN